MSAPEPTASSLQGESLRVIPFRRFWQRRPFLGVFLVLLVSNLFGSVFNFLYNDHLIVRRLMTLEQQRVFWTVASVIYNAIAYPACLGAVIYFLWPLRRCLVMQARGAAVPPAFLEQCRRRVLNWPFLQIIINLLGWLPGAVFFPWIVVALGGPHEAHALWMQFGISFVVSAFFTTVQTFFLLEAYLVEILYPAFFQGARPADVQGMHRITFEWRFLGLWLAVGVMPLVALWTVAVQGPLPTLAWGVLLVGGASGFVIFWVLRRDLGRWITLHAAATDLVARGFFNVRIREQRPDEWGKLTDHFNDMAAALGRSEQMRETFGQLVHPEVRDAIMERFPGLKVTLEEITVLFADIRGFTRRCAGEPPERVGTLLNRFLTLAVEAVEGNGGLVNKFLGDGIMALFGATHHDDEHADRAVASALALAASLRELNTELERAGQTPLQIGVGIHTGPALVGCFGAEKRREFTAIGETVNLGQRVEQLTKQLGGPILMSHATKNRLHQARPCEDLGEHQVPGAPAPIHVYRLGSEDAAERSSSLAARP